MRSPGHSAVAPLKLGSFRLSLGPVKASLEALRGSAGSSRLQMNLPLPSELFAPALPLPLRSRRLLQSPPPLLSSFETTTTDPLSSRGCHQQEREEPEGRREREEEEEAPEGCGAEKSNAALEEGDAGEVTAAADDDDDDEEEEEEEEENDAAAEGSPQCRLPCALASPWLTRTLAAHAAETGGSHAMPASATSSSKAPHGESS